MGYKFIISKLSGFAKFDLDTKINRFQFFHLLEELSQVEISEEEGSAGVTQVDPSHVDEPIGEDEAADQKASRKAFNEEKY